MRKIYYLSTCSTCARIIKELGLGKKGFRFQDIKTQKLTATELVELKNMAGSYAALFSKVALKYRAMKLNERELSEKEMKELILSEYTFLKRPVIVAGEHIFIGNAPRTVKLAAEHLRGK